MQPRAQQTKTYQPKVRNLRKGETTNEDPLVAFSNRFTMRSWREFTACPLPLKAASMTIANNYGILSVGDTDGPFTLVYYRDTKEEALKEYAQDGQITVPKEMYWQVKGCIFDSNTGDLKARGFPYTPCVGMNEQDLMQLVGTLSPKALIREWREGDVVLVWTDDSGTVRVSKTRRINALRSRKEGCPSVEEILGCCNVDLSKLRSGVNGIPLGTVFVLLLVHPMNQIQNPESVEPSVYHLDTWMRVGVVDGAGKQHNGNQQRRQDTFLSLRRKDIDVGLQKLKALTLEEAITLFRANKSLYIQRTEASGLVVRSLALAARYTTRGEREHLYCRYVELGQEANKLYDCVPFAYKEKVAEFPTRYASDYEALLNYCEEVVEKKTNPPAIDTSLAALLESETRLKVKHDLENNKSTFRDRITQLTKQCPSVVLYNMISLLRTKYKKRERLDMSAGERQDFSNDGSRSTSPIE